MYKWRHLIENLFSKLREFKRIALRAEKTDQSFAAVIHLAAPVINSRSSPTDPSRVLKKLREMCLAFVVFARFPWLVGCESRGTDAGRGSDERGAVLVCRHRGSHPAAASVADDAAADECGAGRARLGPFGAL
jgi:hypothetical protein